MGRSIQVSKRSGMSRIQDLRRKFVDIGRYRYILHKFDMEPWLDKTCPICHKAFTKEPNFYFMGIPVHSDCSMTDAYDVWLEAKYNEYNVIDDEGE